MYVFTKPSARAGCDTRSIFKAGFNRFKFNVFLLALREMQRTLPRILLLHKYV